jgi:hypothetical protein
MEPLPQPPGDFCPEVRRLYQLVEQLGHLVLQEIALNELDSALLVQWETAP